MLPQGGTDPKRENRFDTKGDSPCAYLGAGKAGGDIVCAKVPSLWAYVTVRSGGYPGDPGREGSVD